ncbi:MAG: hypothetical protein ACSHX9_01565 [Luteolibacter sp.]
MVLKFFHRKEINAEPGGLDYLMRDPTARVIRGNPEITQAAIDASPPRMVQRFTACVLNGCPPQMPPEKEQILIDRLEGQFLMGRGRESMPWCVVEHTGKGLVEKHIVIPNFDPVFDKIVYPYVDRIDRRGFRAWLEYYCLENDLVIPNDRRRTEPDFTHMRLKKEDVEFLREIWQSVERWVNHGMMQTRDDLQLLLSGAGYDLRCEKHAGGSLEQPVVVGPRGNSLRLTGSTYYRPDFGIKPAVKFDPKDPEDVVKRIAAARAQIARHHEFRAWQLVGRLFGRQEQLKVAKGRAKKHLVRLVGEKMKAERRLLHTLPLLDLKHLIRVNDAHKSGMKPEILERRPCEKSIAESCPVEKTEMLGELVPANKRRVEDSHDEDAIVTVTTPIPAEMVSGRDGVYQPAKPRGKQRSKRMERDDSPNH